MVFTLEWFLRVNSIPIRLKDVLAQITKLMKKHYNVQQKHTGAFMLLMHTLVYLVLHIVSITVFFPLFFILFLMRITFFFCTDSAFYFYPFHFATLYSGDVFLISTRTSFHIPILIKYK